MLNKKIMSKLIVLGLVFLQIPCFSIQAYAEPMEDCDEVESEEILNFYINEPVKSLKKVDARNAIALDANTGEILFAQKADEIVAMASTTKIMTALVAINYGKLDEMVTISKKAAGIRGSTVGYSAGEQVSLKELVFGLMFRSGNDAAIAIAEHIGGSVEGFSNIMNSFAKSIGILNSHFESPHGLDSQNHYSSAYDLALLTSKAMKNDLFREIASSKQISRDKYNFKRDYININKILHLIPNANGVKTGYTGQAGKYLVSSVNHNGRDIIIVVLNCTDRWNQTAKIYNYVATVYDFRETAIKNIVNDSSYSKLGSLIQEDEFSYGYKDEAEKDIQVFSDGLDIKKGDVIGKITLNQEREDNIKVPIISNQDISKDAFKDLLNEAESK